MQKFAGKTGNFSKNCGIICVFLSSLLLTSCGSGRQELRHYTKLLNIDFSSGEVISYEDNHGGFLGDGFMLLITQYGNDTVEDQIKESDKFRSFPLSKNLHDFLYGEDDWGPFDLNLNVPEFNNGYFYFYNRHVDATHKETDEDLFNTVSFNFSFILCNVDNDLAYICDYDT